MHKFMSGKLTSRQTDIGKEEETRDHLPGISIMVSMSEDLTAADFKIDFLINVFQTDSVPCEVIFLYRSIEKESELQSLQAYSENVRMVDCQKCSKVGEEFWAGIQSARYSIIFFLPPGVEIRMEFISSLLRYFNHDDTFAVSPLVFSAEGLIDGLSLQIPYIKQGHIRFRDWDWEKVLHSLPRPVITLRNRFWISLVSRNKLMALGRFGSLFDEFDNLCIRAWLRGWRCYTAIEATATQLGDGSKSCPVTSGALGSIPINNFRAEDAAEHGIEEVINVFSKYYGDQPPDSFKARVEVSKRRRVMAEDLSQDLTYIRGLEHAAVKRLGSAYTDTKIIDLGCGANKFPGAFGVDLYPAESVDLVCDLDQIPWPIEDQSCDLLIASHIMEHVRNFGGVLLECYRILRYEGTLIVRCPHFSCRYSYLHPMHVRHLSYDSIKILTHWSDATRTDLSCYQAPFYLIQTHLIFRGRSRARIGRFLANRKARAWEQYWSRIFPAREICWVLRKLRPRDAF